MADEYVRFDCPCCGQRVEVALDVDVDVSVYTESVRLIDKEKIPHRDKPVLDMDVVDEDVRRLMRAGVDVEGARELGFAPVVVDALAVKLLRDEQD